MGEGGQRLRVQSPGHTVVDSLSVGFSQQETEAMDESSGQGGGGVDLEIGGQDTGQPGQEGAGHGILGDLHHGHRLGGGGAEWSQQLGHLQPQDQLIVIVIVNSSQLSPINQMSIFVKSTNQNRVLPV